MNSALTKGLKRGSDELKDLEASFLASGILRARLIEVLTQMHEAEMKARLNASDYENAAWAYKQADAIGFSRAITKIINILGDDKKNN